MVIMINIVVVVSIHLPYCNCNHHHHWPFKIHIRGRIIRRIIRVTLVDNRPDIRSSSDVNFKLKGPVPERPTSANPGLDKKTLLKIWLNPGLNLTIFRGTGTRSVL